MGTGLDGISGLKACAAQEPSIDDVPICGAGTATRNVAHRASLAKKPAVTAVAWSSDLDFKSCVFASLFFVPCIPV